MAWNDPNNAAFDVGDVLSAQTMQDYVRDNLLELKDPPSEVAVIDEATDYTTTNTSFEDVDNTDGTFSLTINTNGGDVMVGFCGMVNINTNPSAVFFNISVNGTDVAADDGITGARTQSGVYRFPTSFVYLLTGLDAGEYIINLRWKVDAGTATLYAGAGTTSGDIHPQFWVREVS